MQKFSAKNKRALFTKPWVAYPYPSSPYSQQDNPLKSVLEG